MVNAVDSDRKWLYRAGGISALILGIGYIVIIALYVPIGAPRVALRRGSRILLGI